MNELRSIPEYITDSVLEKRTEANPIRGIEGILTPTIVKRRLG
jgi:hypothetical protein